MVIGTYLTQLQTQVMSDLTIVSGTYYFTLQANGTFDFGPSSRASYINVACEDNGNWVRYFYSPAAGVQFQANIVTAGLTLLLAGWTLSVVSGRIILKNTSGAAKTYLCTYRSTAPMTV